MAARQIKGRWFVDFRFEGERVRKKSPINTKRGAEEYERKLRLELSHGTDGGKEEQKEAAPLKVVPTVKQFSQEFISVYARANNKPSEVQTKTCIFRKHLVPEFGHLRLDEVDSRRIEHFKAKKLAEKLAPKSINNYLTVLSRMLGLAVEWGVIAHAPKIKWLKAPDPEFDFLTFEEAERLVNALDGRDAEWRTMILVALKTGLRLGELIALRWEDVDLHAGKLVVRRNCVRGIVGTPKSGRSREVALSEMTVSALKKHRHLRGELVFCNEDGSMLVKGETKWPLWRASKRASLRLIGWHALRHTFASHLAMRGVPLKAVQELMGHATIEMTMRYAHLAPTVKREAVAQLDRPAPGIWGNGSEAGIGVGMEVSSGVLGN
jgi:integrase